MLAARCVCVDSAAVKSAAVRATVPVRPLTESTVGAAYPVICAVECVCEKAAAVKSDAVSETVPVRPLMLATPAGASPTMSVALCVCADAAASSSALVTMTLPVRPCTDCTGTSRPMIVNDPLVVVTVMFAPASTNRLGTWA